MRILVILALGIIFTSCSGGSNDFGAAAVVQRLILTAYSNNSNEISLTVVGTTSGSFPAVTYYIYGTNTDMGDQSIIPLRHERINEQAFGPFAFGDAPQQIDLSPWQNNNYIYLRALLVSPNKGWKLTPGNIYEFSTN